MRVRTYYNLNQSCWSIMAMEGPDKGRVIGHARAVSLGGCTFKVSEAGRQRVIEEQRKNVHAFIEGELRGTVDFTARYPGYIDRYDALTMAHVAQVGKRVSYNPYRAPWFYECDSVDRCMSAQTVVLTGDRKVYAYGLVTELPHIDEAV